VSARHHRRSTRSSSHHHTIHYPVSQARQPALPVFLASSSLCALCFSLSAEPRRRGYPDSKGRRQRRRRRLFNFYLPTLSPPLLLLFSLSPLHTRSPESQHCCLPTRISRYELYEAPFTRPRIVTVLCVHIIIVSAPHTQRFFF